jgi:hypothetical protein
MLLAALLVAGCSTVKIAYDRLDSIVMQYVNEQVSLTPEQNRHLRTQLASTRQWHCATQLQPYAQWLRAANADVQTGTVGYARIEARYAELRQLWRVLMEQSADALAELIPSLSDTQVQEYFRNLDRDNAEMWAETLGLSADKLRRRAEREMEEQLERWIGNLTPGQRETVRAWSADRDGAGAAARLEARVAWQQQLRQLMTQRSDDAMLRAGLRQLLAEPERGWSDEYAAQRALRREKMLGLLADIGATLTDRQRAALARRALRWAEDFDDLTCTGARRAGTS